MRSRTHSLGAVCFCARRVRCEHRPIKGDVNHLHAESTKALAHSGSFPQTPPLNARFVSTLVTARTDEGAKN